MPSLIDLKIQQTCTRVFEEAIAEDGWLRKRIRKHVKWALQGFAPGYDMAEREAFTTTVAERIQAKGVRRRFRLFAIRLWDAPYSTEWCQDRAEQIVTDWLADEHIRFGDKRFDWTDGRDIADEEMSNWEAP